MPREARPVNEARFGTGVYRHEVGSVTSAGKFAQHMKLALRKNAQAVADADKAGHKKTGAKG